MNETIKEITYPVYTIAGCAGIFFGPPGTLILWVIVGMLLFYEEDNND